MQVVEKVDEVRTAVAAARNRGSVVGVVPTMGALHAGHVSLMEAARGRCGFVVATIFVNPTQFGESEDLSRYPRTLEQDLEACEGAGVDLVFCPSVEAIYPKWFTTFVEVEGLSGKLEGASRPGHFRGVATVVLKLFNIVQPDVAFFGQKDYQQQALIRAMVRDLDVPVEIVVCPIVRDSDGLALSSRNRFLTAEERPAARSLFESLELARRELGRRNRDLSAICAAMRAHLERAPGVTPDYALIVHPRTLEELKSPAPEMVALVAARIGAVRLIDNMHLQL